MNIINQLAEEAANKIHWAHVKKPDAYTQEDIARTKTIIKSAIEKAHQEGWYEGRKYECEFGVKDDDQRTILQSSTETTDTSVR